MSIEFNARRWQETKANYGKWWAGTLGRPIVNITIGGHAAGRPEPELRGQGFHSFYERSVTPEQIVDRWDYDLATRRYPGDAFPAVFPNFGPGVVAAFIGCDLANGENTVWFHPREPKAIQALSLAPAAAESYWLARVHSIMEAAADRWQGRVQVGMTDLGGNLDIAASFLPGEKLLLALYDSPDDVRRLAWEGHRTWWHYFDCLNRALGSPNPGYTAWTPIFSEQPYYMLQCDFCYMIGPDMFDEFVKPELAASCRRLTNAFYHLDGIGQLPHLDSLLEIPELKGVQWVPGDGQPDITKWPEVYRKIHKAGKRIQFFTSQSPMAWNALDVIADQIGSAEGICMIGWADRSQEDEVLEVIGGYGRG
jgi:5-methyltetrahydrofolate--homocysteine methyltransferase